MKNAARPFAPFIVGLIILVFLISCSQPEGNVLNTTSLTKTSIQTNTITPTSTRMLTPKPTITQSPSATYTPTFVVNPNSLFLSDMRPYNGPKNVYQGLALDRVYWQEEIWIYNTYYAKGLGMHAPENGIGFVSYKVPNGYTKFISVIGLARQDGSPICKSGDVNFRVFVNNEPRYESGVIQVGHPSLIQLPVVEGDVLRLEVDNAGDDYECDHATWADARFEP